MATEITDTTIVIIGAGFAGVCMAIQLKKAGIDDFVIVEANDEVGGTWYDNTYPGCTCDVPSHLYSFSFEQHPDWSRKYGPQPEILAYIKSCVERYAIAPHVHLGVAIERSAYDSARATWTVTSTDGRRWRARFVVSAIGSLRIPSIPAIPGAERFEGPAFHSARWDHSVDLRGKRVAVVGTGASAIQFVPEIAPKASRVYLFQRTPPWVMPKPDRSFGEAERTIFRRVPGAGWLYRKVAYWKQEAPAIAFIRFPKILKIAQIAARKHIAAAISDPVLRDKVTPRFAMGCKRVLVSNNYYPALARDNVEVITDNLDALKEKTVITGGRELEVDAVIYGTGFAIRDFLAPMEVLGRNGVDLTETWRSAPEAYLGSAIHGFPNFFMLTGPNTGLGHSSMIFMIEAHVHYVVGCIRHVLEQDLKSIEVRPEAVRSFNDWVQKRMSRTVWTTGCSSWYLDENGRNFTLWPSFTWAFWLRTRRFRRRDYSFA